jgi:hypothetical protein
MFKPNISGSIALADHLLAVLLITQEEVMTIAMVSKFWAFSKPSNISLW